MELIVNSDTRGVLLNGQVVDDAELVIDQIVSALFTHSNVKVFKNYNLRNLIGINKLGNVTVYKFILDGGIKWLNLSLNFINKFEAELHSTYQLFSLYQDDEDLMKLISIGDIKDTIDEARHSADGLLKTYQPDFLVEVSVENNVITDVTGGLILLDTYSEYDKSLKVFNTMPDYFNIYLVPSHTFGSGKLCTPLSKSSVRVSDIYKVTHRTVWSSEYSVDLFGSINAMIVFTYIAHLVAEGKFDKSKYLGLIETYYQLIKL